MNKETEKIVKARRKEIDRHIHRIVAGGLAIGSLLMLAARWLLEWLFRVT